MQIPSSWGGSLTLEPLPAVLHEGVDPLLDLALPQVLLPGCVHDRLMPFDDLQNQFRFSLGRPPLYPWVADHLPAHDKPPFSGIYTALSLVQSIRGSLYSGRGC